jgi:hypothetical protein
LVLEEVFLIDWASLLVALEMIFGSGVHAAKMLCEEIFAVEVVGVE